MKRSIAVFFTVLLLLIFGVYASTQVVDDFEYSSLADNGWSGANIDDGDCSTQQSTVFKNSYALSCSSADAIESISKSYSFNDDSEFVFNYYLEDSTDVLNIRLFDSGTRYIIIAPSRQPSDDRIWYYDGSWKDTGVSVTENQWQELKLDINYSQGTYDIVLDDSTIESGASFENSASGFDKLKIFNEDDNGDSSSAFVDYINTVSDSSNTNTASWFDSSYDYRRETLNTDDENLVYPFVDEDPDSDGASSTYYGQKGFIYYNSDNDFIFANESQRFGASTFIDGSKNQQVTGSTPSSLEGYWALDNDDGFDLSGNGNNGSLTNGVTTGRNGVVSNSFSFDGSEGYVDTSYSGDFGTGAFTVSTWVKMNELRDDESNYLVSNYDGSDGFILSRSLNGNIRFFVNGDPDLSNNNDLPSDTWHHITAVRESDGTARLYFNGSENVSSTGSGNVNSTENIHLGGRPDLSTPDGNHLNGSLDDARVYSRALSSSEVQTLYDSTDSGDPTFGSEETESTDTAAPVVDLFSPNDDAQLEGLEVNHSANVTVYDSFDELQLWHTNNTQISVEKDTDEDFAVRNGSSAGTYAHTPHVNLLHDGVLLASWREDGQHGLSSTGKMMVARCDTSSSDCTQSSNWGSTITAADEADVDDRNHGVLEIQNSSGGYEVLMAYGVRTTDQSDEDFFLKKSFDGGQTWNSRVQLDSDANHTYGRGQPRRLSNGDIVIPAYGSEDGSKPRHPIIFRSTDDGDTWNTNHITKFSSNMGEFNIVELKNESTDSFEGRVYGASRNSDNNEFVEIISYDYGQTWQLDDSTDIPMSSGGNPIDFDRLDDGTTVTGIYEKDNEQTNEFIYTDDELSSSWNLEGTIIEKTSDKAHYPSFAQYNRTHGYVVYGDESGSSVSNVLGNLVTFGSDDWIKAKTVTNGLNNDSLNSVIYNYSSAGEYSWNIKAVQGDGQSSFANQNRTLTVEDVDNTAPSITIDNPSNTTYSSSSVDLNVTSDEAANFTWNVDGGTNSTSNEDDQDLNETLTGLSDGGHTVNVYASDSAGNTGYSSQSFTIDTPSGYVEINDSVQINQSGNNVFISGNNSFQVDYLDVYNNTTDFGGSNFTVNGSLSDRIDLELEFYNKSKGVGSYPFNFSVDTVDGNNVSFEFSGLTNSDLYRIYKDGNQYDQSTVSSGALKFYHDTWTSGVYTPFDILRTNSNFPEVVSSQIRRNFRNSVSRVELGLDDFGENDINGFKGTGTKNTFTNETLKVDVNLPVDSKYNVSDTEGLTSPSKNIDLSETDTGVVEDSGYSHNLDSQRQTQDVSLTNNGSESIDYLLNLSTGEDFSGSIGVDSKVEKSGSKTSDFINNKTHGFSVDTNEVTLGFNYTGHFPLEVDNTASNSWTGVDTTGAISSPTKCGTSNNTAIDVSASTKTNFSVEQNCNPGNKGNPSQSIVNASGSADERIWYNSTDMTVYTNKTSETNFAIRADKDNLKNPDQRDADSLKTIVEGVSAEGNNNLNVTDTGGYFRVTVGDIQSSTLYTDDSDWSVTYTLSGDNTTVIDDGGSTGSTGPSTDDQTVYFGQAQTTEGLETFNVEFGTETVRNMTITNTAQEDLTAQISTGSTGICQYISVRPTLNSDQWSSSGSYSIEAASLNNLGTVQDETVDTQVRFQLPNRTELENVGINDYSCDFTTGASYGVAEPLTMQVEEGFSLERLLNGWLSDYCFNLGGLTGNFTGDQVEQGDEVCVTVEHQVGGAILGGILLFGFVGVRREWF